MAKRSNEPSVGDKAKVRVLFAEVEGNNESVQEALKTMVLAMSRPVRVISEQKPNGTAALLTDHPVDEVGETIEQGEEQLREEEEDAPAARKARGSGKKVDRNASLELVPDLNFRPPEHPAFRSFFTEKSPSTDVDASVVSVYYMQKMMNLAKIGPSHVLTALKDASWPIPVDLKQTIRNVKSSKMWLNFSDITDLKTTTQGDNDIEHDMGKGSLKF